MFIIVIINLFDISFSLILLKDFTGNSDRNSVVYHELNLPIRARYLRFLPANWDNYIAMRVELYGCACAGTEQSFSFSKMSLK